MASLWSAGVSVLFLFSEGVLHTGLRRLVRRCRSQREPQVQRIGSADTSSLLHEEDMKVTDPRFTEDCTSSEAKSQNGESEANLALQDYMAIRGGGFTAIMRTLMSIEMRTQPLNCV